METELKQSYLYDFYGELLTQHQRRVYEDVVFNDLSLSEIAKEQGVTRQGVHDLVRRCDRILEGYEEKLHLVKKFQETRRLANEIQKLLEEYQETKDHILLRKAKEMAEKIVDI